MKRLLIDINVILDAILDRSPHAAAAALLWSAAESKRIQALVPGHGMTTLFYLLAKAKGSAFARRAVGGLVGVFEVAALDHAVIARAVALGWPDFEDAVCAAAAEAAGCEAIVTGNPKHFSGAWLPVLAPETAASLIHQTPPDRADEASGPATERASSDRPARRTTLPSVKRVRRARRQGKRSARELLGGLVGSVAAHPDLSSNPRYLRGYGR